MANPPTTDLQLVEDFANTFDIEAGTDVLDDPATFAAWLTEKAGGGARAVAPDDLLLARQLRDALRDELTAHHDRAPSPEARQALAAAAAQLPLVVDLRGAGPLELVPAGTVSPARAVLSRVVAAMARASVDGTWERLKLCPASDCRWAFYDASKNRSKRWCAMEVCGNRNKTRTYRTRHGAADG